jgi:hypothetical protein
MNALLWQWLLYDCEDGPFPIVRNDSLIMMRTTPS